MRVKLGTLAIPLLVATGASAGILVGKHLGAFAGSPEPDGPRSAPAPSAQGNGGGLLDPTAKPRPVAPRGELDPAEEKTIEIFKNASPSVAFVTRFALQYSFWMDPVEVREGAGSGFVWSEKGYIVTNYHVVGDPNDRGAEWKVSIGDKVWDARLVGRAPDRDLAVLKIVETDDNPLPKLKPIPLGSSKDLQVGQRVYAIGNPFGLDRTLTSGLISALNREIRSPANRLIRGVIQTDAAINPGNSGGPLLDSAGRLIGVNTAIVSSSGSSAGIGFAVPVDTLNEIVPQLIRRGYTTKADLGVVYAQDVLARRFGVEAGVLIAEVPPKAAEAKNAGLRTARIDQRSRRLVVYDIITAVDGQPVTDVESLYRLLEDKKSGDKVKLTLMRDNRKQKEDVTVTLEEFPG